MSASGNPSLPALLGDGNGNYRVHIVGNSGTGKSTLGLTLASILNVPFISMDTIAWKPGWVMSSPEEFQAKLRRRIEEAERTSGGWVADGNYTKFGGGLVYDASTDVVWLDPPLLLYLPRIILRTFQRMFRLVPPCAPGCLERPSEVFFSKESIIWWCISQHWPNRRLNRKRMADIGIDIGRNTAGRKMRRIGGWGRGLREWVDAVKSLVAYKSK